MRILIILILSIISGACYRLGGAAKKGNSLDFARNTKTRDAGCPLVLLAVVWALWGFQGHNWWVYVITFGLSWSTLTTYWDFVYGYDNYYVHGLMCGLAALPLCLIIPPWIIVLRIAICTFGMGIWSERVNDDVIEEVGRGVLFIL